MDGFDILIKNYISPFASSANPIERLSYKLKEIKKSIKACIPERTRNWSSRLQEIEASILGIDIQAETCPIPLDLWHRKQVLRRHHHNILLEQELYWKQRSRVQWLKEGDLNTTFFHKIANGRRRSNSISSLLINGTHTDSPEVIRRSFEQFFSSLFNKPKCPLVNINWDHLLPWKITNSSVLELLFTEDEVSKCVFSLPGEKSPRPDGFPLWFFQHF